MSEKQEGIFKVVREGNLETQYVGKNIVKFFVDDENGYHLIKCYRNPAFPYSFKEKVKLFFRRCF